MKTGDIIKSKGADQLYRVSEVFKNYVNAHRLSSNFTTFGEPVKIWLRDISIVEKPPVSAQINSATSLSRSLSDEALETTILDPGKYSSDEVAMAREEITARKGNQEEIYSGQKWEYLRLQAFRGKDGSYKILYQGAQLPYTENIDELLNKLGKEGWELVGISREIGSYKESFTNWTYTQTNTEVLFFKRPLGVVKQ